MRVVVGQYDLEKEDREEMTFNIEDVHLHHKWNNKKIYARTLRFSPSIIKLQGVKQWFTVGWEMRFSFL